MVAPTYGKSKYYRIMDRTQSNYANQLKRLSLDERRSNFILIYYSIMLIICSLSVKFYPDFFDVTWISYSNIILSMIVLIFSIVNSKADYTNRIAKIQNALNTVKRLKRELGCLPELVEEVSSASSTNSDLPQSENSTPSQQVSTPLPSEITAENIDKFEHLKKEYDSVVSSTEVRDDLDFFQTIRHLCKRYGLNHLNGNLKKGFADNDENREVIEEIKGYISEINPLVQWAKIIYLAIFHAFLYLVPLIILGLGIYIKYISQPVM